jgi:hypothetical protein
MSNHTHSPKPTSTTVPSTQEKRGRSAHFAKQAILSKREAVLASMPSMDDETLRDYALDGSHEEQDAARAELTRRGLSA